MTKKRPRIDPRHAPAWLKGMTTPYEPADPIAGARRTVGTADGKTEEQAREDKRRFCSDVFNA